MLIIGLISLLMIEDMCCLCELCFNVRKLVVWIVWIVVFFRQWVNDTRNYPRVSLLDAS
jgi:hypothetical protein